MRFFKKKTRWPRGKSAQDVHDEHRDQIMHHLNELHKLTHKDSLIHRATAKLGESSQRYHDMHGHVIHLLKKNNSLYERD